MKRKVHKGEIYDKERTKQKFVDAVGKIIRTKGYAALGVNKIAEVAGANKKLIYVYFGSVKKLIETYIKSQDYWQSFNNTVVSSLDEHRKDYGQRLAHVIPKAQFDYFQQSKEMQKILLWELSEKNRMMRKVADEREKIGSEIFKLSDPLFENSDIDIRATYSLLVAGIYYLILHAATNGSTFCEIDITKHADRDRVLNEIDRIVEEAYKSAKKSSPKTKLKKTK